MLIFLNSKNLWFQALDAEWHFLQHCRDGKFNSIPVLSGMETKGIDFSSHSHQTVPNCADLHLFFQKFSYGDTQDPINAYFAPKNFLGVTPRTPITGEGHPQTHPLGARLPSLFFRASVTADVRLMKAARETLDTRRLRRLSSLNQTAGIL